MRMAPTGTRLKADGMCMHRRMMRAPAEHSPTALSSGIPTLTVSSATPATTSAPLNRSCPCERWCVEAQASESAPLLSEALAPRFFASAGDIAAEAALALPADPAPTSARSFVRSLQRTPLGGQHLEMPLICRRMPMYRGRVPLSEVACAHTNAVCLPGRALTRQGAAAGWAQVQGTGDTRRTRRVRCKEGASTLGPRHTDAICRCCSKQLKQTGLICH